MKNSNPFVQNGDICFIDPLSADYMADLVASEELHGIEQPEAACRRPLAGFESYAEESWISYRKGNVGVIDVTGLIVPDAPAWTTYFGMSPLSLHRREASLMEADESITDIVFKVNTPGGNARGLSSQFKFIDKLTTKTHTYVDGQCCSAGYFFASATSQIVGDEMSETGSIGAMFRFVRNDGAMRQAGLEPVTVVSEQSPNKVITDPKNLGLLQERVNELADIFIGYVAKGRNVTKETVLSDFGKGGTFIGQKAVDAGLMDSVMEFDEFIATLMTKEEDENNNQTLPTMGGFGNMCNGTPSEGSSEKGESSMPLTMDELKALQAENPELFQQITDSAKMEAGETARKAEQERVAKISALRGELTDASPVALAAAEKVIQDAILDPEATVEATTAAMFKAAFTAKAEVAENLEQHGANAADAATVMGNTTPQEEQTFEAGTGKDESIYMTASKNLENMKLKRELKDD